MDTMLRRSGLPQQIQSLRMEKEFPAFSPRRVFDLLSSEI